MPYEVTLEKDGLEKSVIVETAELNLESILLKGSDPYNYPDEFQDDIMFLSKDLTAYIVESDSVSVVKIEPTEEEVPEPEVSY